MRERHIAVFDTIEEDGRTSAEAVMESYERRGERASVRTFTDNQMFLADFRDRHYDMVFLALNSPLDLAVARGAGQTDRSCPIIFVSGSGDYAVEAFRLPALDYLLKPVTRERVDESVGGIASEPVYSRRVITSKIFQ
ncbi:MAG: hypothetical protein FWF44_01945 [Defluviitaleaceae bacterium]|nr:hypothetical protein [Defluviitaleaceae bacterium]